MFLGRQKKVSLNSTLSVIDLHFALNCLTVPFNTRFMRNYENIIHTHLVLRRTGICLEEFPTCLFLLSVMTLHCYMFHFIFF